MGSFRICAAAFAGLAIAGPWAAIAARAQDINGQWSCVWVDLERDWEFECAMTPIVDPAGQALGEIRWTMTRSPKPQDQSRSGRWLYGPTWTHGAWTGRFFATRP